MDDCVYTSWRQPVETTSKELVEARKNTIRNMIYFRNDKPLYIFWRNVFRHYRNISKEEMQ